MVQVNVGSYDEERRPEGLSDQGHIILECSSCGKPLIDIWVVKADPMERTYRAQCCYCGDRSFQKTVSGRTAIVGISKPNPLDPEDFIPVTRWTGNRQDGEVTTLFTEQYRGS